MLNMAKSRRSCNDKDTRRGAIRNGKRISAATWKGQRIWIKCQIYEKPSLKRRLHASISNLLPVPWLRAVPRYSPKEMNRLEIQKLTAFRAANIPTPEILCAYGPVLIVSDVGHSIQNSLDKLLHANPHLHDSLLIQCAETLGAVHAAGLCHGRPHPQDMFLSNGRAGFFDFREYPESIMPLAMAQARDIWLLFTQIMAQALEPQRTASTAFMAWRRHISLETLESLRQLVHFFRIFIGPLKFARPIYLGDNSKRMLCAIEFFISHLGL